MESELEVRSQRLRHPPYSAHGDVWDLKTTQRRGQRRTPQRCAYWNLYVLEDFKRDLTELWHAEGRNTVSFSLSPLWRKVWTVGFYMWHAYHTGSRAAWCSQIPTGWLLSPWRSRDDGLNGVGGFLLLLGSAQSQTGACLVRLWTPFNLLLAALKPACFLFEIQSF